VFANSVRLSPEHDAANSPISSTSLAVNVRPLLRTSTAPHLPIVSYNNGVGLFSKILQAPKNHAAGGGQTGMYARMLRAWNPPRSG
jgi:hypothetical protein